MSIVIAIILAACLVYLMYSLNKIKTELKNNEEYTSQAFSSLGGLVHIQFKERIEKWLKFQPKLYDNWNLGFDRKLNKWVVYARFDDKSGRLLLAEEAVDLNRIIKETVGA